MVSNVLGARYAERLPLLEVAADSLTREVRDALAGVPHVDRITFRVKEATSFLAKATAVDAGGPRYAEPFREIEDQVAGRVLVFFRRDLDLIEGMLRKTFRTQEVRVKEPVSAKEFDYESRHQIFLFPEFLLPDAWTEREDLPIAFEMQVRTLFMHAWAEPQHDLGYKGEGSLPRQAERLLALAAASAWGADHAIEEALEVISHGASEKVDA